MNPLATINIIIQYEGSGFILLLYAAAFVLLLKNETDRGNRVLFGYLPLALCVLFLLPPVHGIYSKIEGSDTYYRLFWLLPAGTTIVYAAVRTFADHLRRMLILMAFLIFLCGSNVYENRNIVKAENRLHIPQAVLDVCNTITNDTGGKPAMAAMPSELVQFVRQYDTRIMMPYGREMLMPAYANYYNAVYAAMEQSDPIDAEQLAEAITQYNCRYVVVNRSRQVKGDLSAEGLELVSELDAYQIWRNPEEKDTDINMSTEEVKE